MKIAVAEFIGTLTLVLFGCGAAVLAGADIGLAGISFAFGLALVGMGRWPEERIAEVLAARDRQALGLNAPPEGLYFVTATY